MEMVNLVMAVEKEYALNLPDSFLETSETLGELFDYVTRHGIGCPMSVAARPSD